MNSLEIDKSIFLNKLWPYETSTKINGSLRRSFIYALIGEECVFFKPDIDIGVNVYEAFEGYRKRARKERYALENSKASFIKNFYRSTICKVSPRLQKTKLAAQLLQAFLPKRSK